MIYAYLKIFAQNVNWRCCFWMNLPAGVVVDRTDRFVFWSVKRRNRAHSVGNRMLHGAILSCGCGFSTEDGRCRCVVPDGLLWLGSGEGWGEQEGTASGNWNRGIRSAGK